MVFKSVSMFLPLAKRREGVVGPYGNGRPRRGTSYVTCLSFYNARDLRMRPAIVGRMAPSRGNRIPRAEIWVPSCPIETRAYGHLAKRGLEFMQLARVKNWQFYIAVQDVQQTLAYTIHEFFLLQFVIKALRHQGSAVLSTWKSWHMHFTRFIPYIKIDDRRIFCREYIGSNPQNVIPTLCQIQDEVTVGLSSNIQVSVI